LTFSPAPSPGTRRRIRLEIGIVLALSLGAAAVYSVIAIVNRLTQDVPISQQTATLNPSLSDRPVFDLIYQLLDIAFALVPVLLVLYLLWQPGRSPFRRLGFDASRPGRDLGAGLLLTLAIGLPGLGLYFAGRALGITPTIVTSGLTDQWWTIPVLILSALRSALTEELIVVGFLFTRLHELGHGRWPVIIGAAILRGTYHLYQGFGSFVGNVAMGIVFGWVYEKWGRTTPLVIAHWILDIASFVGYALVVAWFPGLVGT
jgi:membrane protease YdiL (CAAX protease family)